MLRGAFALQNVCNITIFVQRKRKIYSKLKQNGFMSHLELSHLTYSSECMTAIFQNMKNVNFL